MQSIQTSRIKHARRFGDSYNDICQRLIAKEKMFRLTTVNKETDV